MSFHVRAGLLGVLLLMSAACQDQPVGPMTVQSPEAPNVDRTAEDPGHVSAICYVRRRTSATTPTWQARTASFELPRSAASLDGTVREYHYRGYAGGEMVANAHCMIPNSEKAERDMDRLLGVAKKVAGGSDLGGIGIMGCVRDGFCEVEGVTAIGCVGGGTWPDCNGIMKPSDIPQCSAFGECGDVGWTPVPPPGGPPPGPSPEPLPGDVDGDGDALDDGVAAFGLCVASQLGPGGWGAIVATGWGAYELWSAQSDVRHAQRRYEEYHEMMGSPFGGEAWNYSTDELYRLRYEQALGDRNLLAKVVGSTAGLAAWELTRAMIKCGPVAAAPTP